jgi:ATP-dependent DNA helicase RecG
VSEETQLVEWKSNWRDEWLQWIAGYANAQGGVLEIGKNDAGEVIGLEGTKRLLENIPNKIRQGLGIVVDVDLKHLDGKPYISISIQPYSFPISYRSKYSERKLLAAVG